MANKYFEIQSVIHRPEYIEFTWQDVGGTYKVYRNNNLLYEGTVARFRDGNFKQAKMYHYSIERVVNDQVLEVIALQTTAFANRHLVTNPLQFLVFTTIVAKTQIALSWEAIKDVTTYEIYRNDEFVREVQATQYIDRDFLLDEPYTYRIQAQRPLSKSEETWSKEKSVVSTVLGKIFQNDSKGDPAIERFTVTKKIAKPKQLLLPTGDREQTKKINKWQFRYTTFLLKDFIRNPNRLSKNYYFQGDGRGFNPKGQGYRTRVDVKIDTTESPGVVQFEKKIGRTVALNRFGQVRREGFAATEGIILNKHHHQGEEVGFELTHAVKNPLIPSPSIDYEVWAIMRKDGLFDMTGYHDPSPNHEIYLLCNEGQEWLPIYLAEDHGLAWMSEMIAYHYWRFSNFE